MFLCLLTCRRSRLSAIRTRDLRGYQRGLVRLLLLDNSPDDHNALNIAPDFSCHQRVRLGEEDVPALVCCVPLHLTKLSQRTRGEHESAWVDRHTCPPQKCTRQNRNSQRNCEFALIGYSLQLNTRMIVLSPASRTSLFDARLASRRGHLRRMRRQC